MGFHPFGCRYDVNGDNEVSMDELSSMVIELHGEVVPDPNAPPMSSEDLVHIADLTMSQNDINGDHVLDKEEFVQFFVSKVLNLWINGDFGGVKPEMRSHSGIGFNAPLILRAPARRSRSCDGVLASRTVFWHYIDSECLRHCWTLCRVFNGVLASRTTLNFVDPGAELHHELPHTP